MTSDELPDDPLDDPALAEGAAQSDDGSAAPGASSSLPPAASFALAARASGATTAETAVFMRLDEAVVAKHLRAAVRLRTGAAPPPAAGPDALEAALAPVLEAHRAAQAARASKPCPCGDVVDALADGLLDGPLLLDTLEKIAAHPTCMTRLIERTRGGPREAVQTSKARGGCLGAALVLVAVAGGSVVALATWSGV